MTTIVIIAFLNDHSESPMPHLIQKNDNKKKKWIIFSLVKSTESINIAGIHALHRQQNNKRQCLLTAVFCYDRGKHGIQSEY